MSDRHVTCYVINDVCDDVAGTTHGVWVSHVATRIANTTEHCICEHCLWCEVTSIQKLNWHVWLWPLTFLIQNGDVSYTHKHTWGRIFARIWSFYELLFWISSFYELLFWTCWLNGIDIGQTDNVKHVIHSMEYLYQVRQQSNPLKLCPIFSATTWTFSVKCYMFMWLSYLHLNAKGHLIIFKYNKVTDILAWPPGNFCAL